MARTGKRQPSRSNARTCSSVSTLGMASRLLVAPVARGVAGAGGGEGAGEAAVPEGAVAHDTDAVGEAGRERLVLLAPVQHVIAHLRDVDAARAQALLDHGAREVRRADEANAP